MSIWLRVLFIPGIGPLLIAGPLVGWLVGALESAVLVGGLSALGAGLYGLGIPKDSILRYETALKADKFVVIVHGTSDENYPRQGCSQSHQPGDIGAPSVAWINTAFPTSIFRHFFWHRRNVDAPRAGMRVWTCEEAFASLKDLDAIYGVWITDD